MAVNHEVSSSNLLGGAFLFSFPVVGTFLNSKSVSDCRILVSLSFGTVLVQI